MLPTPLFIAEPWGNQYMWLHRVKCTFHLANSFVRLLSHLKVLILNFQTKKSWKKISKNWWRNSNFTSTLCTFLFYFLILKWGLSGINKIIKNNFQKKNQFFLQIYPTIDPFRDFGAKKKFKLIFLKNEFAIRITYLTLFTHTWIWHRNHKSSSIEEHKIVSFGSAIDAGAHLGSL